MEFSITYATSFLSMLFFAPVIMFISRKYQLIDRPNSRKIHIHYISRLGGVAIFLSIWLSVLIFAQQKVISLQSPFWSSIFFGSLAAFALGIWDDLKNIPAKTKLLFQIFLAFLAYSLGFRINEIELGLGHSIHFGNFSWLITVLWIVTIMNAFNMIDGLDGLAGGFAFLVFLTLGILGYLNGIENVMILSLICAGACFGFLFFNFHPAKMFMGDCGSMMLGFVLAILSFQSGKENVIPNILTPFFLLAFPLIDLLTTVLRRMIHAKTTERVSILASFKRTFNADGNHIHHRLLKRGFSQRTIASFVYTFTILSCLLGLVSIYFSFGLTFFLFIFYLWFTVQCIRLLDYEEFMTGQYRRQKRDLEEKQKLSTAPSLIKKVL